MDKENVKIFDQLYRVGQKTFTKENYKTFLVVLTAIITLLPYFKKIKFLNDKIIKPLGLVIASSNLLNKDEIKAALTFIRTNPDTVSSMVSKIKNVVMRLRVKEKVTQKEYLDILNHLFEMFDVSKENRKLLISDEIED